MCLKTFCTQKLFFLMKSFSSLQCVSTGAQTIIENMSVVIEVRIKVPLAPSVATLLYM